MNVKAFFVSALGGALELGIGTPDDVLRHVTPEVLAQHLPRPLWARLLTACLGAPKVDAQLVVETVGVANLCEHVPATIVWACIAEIAARALGKSSEQPTAIPAPIVESKSAPAPAAKSGARVALAPAPPLDAPRRPTPPPSPAVQGPAIPPVEHADEPARPAPSQRFRQASTGIGRVGATGAAARRPQAQAAPAPAPAPASQPAARVPGRRGSTEAESETETSVESGDWRGKEIAVDDSQLVDWSSENTSDVRDEDFGDFSRKR
ncbi:MAG TPA: hypothetical protein VGF94_03840 [Kofleriaceae bacterium]